MFDNEEDVKVKLVYDFLRDCGIERSELKFEKSFRLKLGRYTYEIDTKEQVESAQPRLDILVSRNSTPLCVVEVKSDSTILSQNDIDQAVSYGRLVDPMVPFCILTNGKEFIALDTITKARIQAGDRQTSRGYTISLPDEHYYEAVKLFLGYSRENLFGFCQWQVEVYSRVLTGSVSDRRKKFISELYEPTTELNLCTEDFIKSQSAAFVVSGDAGHGKTCWSCYIARLLLKQQVPTLFFRAGDLRDSILGAIGEDLNLNLTPQSSEPVAAKRFFEIFAQDQVVIIIDGIDEIERATAVRLVDEFLRKTSGGNVKLILTCKTSALDDFFEYRGTPTYLSEGAYQVEEHGAYILAQIEDGQFSRMIDLYRRFYNFDGLFEDRVLDDCKQNPFLLRLMFEVASERSLPYLSYTSLDFYEQFYRKSIQPFSHRESVEAILSEVARYLYDENEEQVDVSEVRKRLGLSVLEELPAELFERNILVRAEANSEQKIGFYFSQLRDYIIAYKAKKWQNQSSEGFEKEIGDSGISGVRLDSLSLYYSLANDEHKRVLDAPLFENALNYVTEYEQVLENHFHAFKGAFPPYDSLPEPRSERLGFIGYFSLNNRRIIYRGFRIIQESDEKVKLLPLAGPSRLSNLAFLSGGRDLMYKGSHGGFREIDISKEVWEDIADDLREITKKGLLNECGSRLLLEERLLAASASDYKQLLGIPNTTVISKSLPLALGKIRYAVLYKRALRVLEH